MSVMTCQSCGAPLDAITADALCPACVLRAALEATRDRPVAAGHLALPRAFGPYDLMEEIGRGGMGVVYAAQQPALGRTVAVKLLLSGAYASEPALRRFQLEAAAAAKLQHPNIVAIHDYGEVNGQPYYAMDLVAGRNLAEICAGRPLPARRAAEILRLLAGAVHYAHQCGVLHRDLKPSNVLVDEQDRPRITDFGLAKILGSTEGGTLTGQMLGSPSYAATEQVAGRDAKITVASDVYGLGALFYHLLTGRAPFNAATPTETLRLVLDTDPPPPRMLNPALPRDLETICLKCLEKEPERRYATAAEVAEDVERFLSERPIRASPPNALYQMAKFARRHRAGVAATGITLLALVVGLAISLTQYRRAVVQRRAADAARGQAEKLVGLMTHDLTPALEQRGGLPQLVKTAEATVQYYESVPSEFRTTKTDQGKADALAALGRLRGSSLHDFKGAEAALRAALALREKIARENPDDPEAAVAWLLEESGLPVLIGQSLTTISKGRWEEMIRRGRELHRRFPKNLRVTQCLADLLEGYASAEFMEFGEPPEATVSAAAAERQMLIEESLVAQPKDNVTAEWKGKSLADLAGILGSSGRSGQAAVAAERALAYYAEALRADPGNLKLREQAAGAAQLLSYYAPSWEKSRDAERVAQEHDRELIELNPDDQAYRFEYAVAHTMQSWILLYHAPDFEASRKAFREFLSLLEPLLARGGYYGAVQSSSCVNIHLWLGVIAAWVGEPAEAREEIARAQLRVADYCSRLPAGSFAQCYARVSFLFMKAFALYCLRDWPAMADAARDSLAQIEAGLRQRPGHRGLLLRQTEANAFLAIAAQHEGRSAEAIAGLRPAIDILRATFLNDSHGSLGIAQRSLIQSLVQHGDTEEARQAAGQLLRFEFGFFQSSELPEQDWEAGVLTLAASLCDSAEAIRCIGLTDRAKTLLTSPDAVGRLTVDGKENLATIARLRAEASANLALEALERTGRQLDAAAATDPEASERSTRAGKAAWDVLPDSSAIASPEAREAELGAREGYRALMERHPESVGYRFLFAETHRMECYVHFGWDGQVEPARAAFRKYDALLEPFVGRKGYGSVLRTRLENSLHLAQLAASVGDKTDADRWIEEARKRFETCRDQLPERSPDRGIALVRFLEESALSAWWLHDWPELARLAQKAQAGCEAALKEQPASEELLKRRTTADELAALALAGAGQNAAAARRLQAETDRLSAILPDVVGVWDGDTVAWPIENASVEVLRINGDTARARRWMDDILWAQEWWVPSFPEYWQAQKHLAFARIRAASFCDLAVPFEAARRKELLDQAAAILAPDKVAGRLTVDVQEALREIEQLRSTSAPPAQ